MQSRPFADEIDDNDIAFQQAIERLNSDLKQAAGSLGPREARYLVDAYYTIQDNRKRFKSQSEAEADEPPHQLLQWLTKQSSTLETRIKQSLDIYTQSHIMGSWMRQIYGIGPVLSAGLLAHINMNLAPTVGHIWNFAGLQPGPVWLSRRAAQEAAAKLPARIRIPDLITLSENVGCDPRWLARRIYSAVTKHDREFLGLKEKTDNEEYMSLVLTNPHIGGDIAFGKPEIILALTKRPWNAELKTLCWKVGQSFMKFSGADQCYYGKLYRQRKTLEIERNEAGDNKETAKQWLTRVGPTTEAYGYYSRGFLPPSQIDARGRRWAVKMFLSHIHAEWYRREFKREPPRPYTIEFLGHAHFVPPPPGL